MKHYSYLVTFSNLFEYKYFKEHLDEFFINCIVDDKVSFEKNIVQHSSRFIEVKSIYSLNTYTLINRFPNVKIVRKVKQNKSTKYYPVKG